MESIGFIDKTGESKKDGTICVLTVLRVLNKVIRPQGYPMPTVLDLLLKNKIVTLMTLAEYEKMTKALKKPGQNIS